jgi:hypothetical protein
MWWETCTSLFANEANVTGNYLATKNKASSVTHSPSQQPAQVLVPSGGAKADITPVPLTGRQTNCTQLPTFSEGQGATMKLQLVRIIFP